MQVLESRTEIDVQGVLYTIRIYKVKTKYNVHMDLHGRPISTSLHCNDYNVAVDVGKALIDNDVSKRHDDSLTLELYNNYTYMG